MSTEVELKLTLPLAQARRLARHPTIRAATVEGPKTRRFYGVYFDTPERVLSHRGIALRVRKEGRRWIQTLKEEGRVEGGMHQRPEYEAAAPKGAVNLKALRTTPVWDLFSDPEVTARLAPIFVTDVRRTLRILKTNGSEVELALDRGEVRARESVEPICELEIELKSGTPQTVYDLALALQQQIRLRLENRSKAERGHALALLVPPGPTKARVPAIDADMPVSVAFQAVAFSCLGHAQANERGVLEGSPDPEYVHQMRVALRRLRSAFSVFGPVLPRPACQPAIDEIRWIAGSLGPAREWDVFATEILPPIVGAFPDHAGLAQLAKAADVPQSEGRQAAREAVASERYERLLLETSAWLACEKWRPVMPEDALPLLAEPLLPFAVRMLQRRHQRAKRRGRDHPRFTPEERHALRIALKKLRYCAEFFSPLFDGEATRAYSRGLADLQDVLGALNDAAVTGRLLRELTPRPPDSGLAEAFGIVSGWTRQFTVERLSHLGQAWERFEDVKPFWR